jgi:glucan-binding YG repeat protein
MNFSGSYTVKIKTVAYTDEQKKVAKDSKTIESTTLYIDDRNTSDGVGQVSETTDTSFVYGWYKQGDYWYYRYQTGLLQQNGWAKINQIWYLFDTQGRMLTGWQVSNGKYYYFLPSGAQYTGWLLNGDKWVYLVPEAELKTGESEGQLTTPGWRSINHLYYYFNADGTMYTGWLNDNGKYYYLNEQNNSLYGVMFTGWIHRNGVTYYCDESGAMVEGWKEIDGEWYYFYPGSGNMAINTYIGSYYVNNDGIWQH